MLSRKALAIASLCTIVCSVSAAAEAKDEFKSKEFLTWSHEGQKSYIMASVVMAAFIAAAQNKADLSKCIGQWMTDSDAAGFPSVKEAMTRFPDYHPSGVIVAILEKACGSFKHVGK